MLVDEYGSNAMFQLPGLLSSHGFEEEEEKEDNFQTNFWKEAIDISPSEHTSVSRDPENFTVTPSDRCHCMLEYVDSELEMKDVSERALFTHGTFEVVFLEPISDGIFMSASNKLSVFLPSPEGSPPLPPGSPPVTPPLPISPPPPLSPPPPPPPPPLPPSPLPLQQHLFPPLFVGPPPQLLFHQSLPPQPASMSRHIPPLSSMISTSPTLASQVPALLREIGDTPTQLSCFPPAGVGKAPEHIGYNLSRPVEYARGDAYMNMQSSQRRQPFLPVSVPFAQMPLHPEPSPQCTPSQFSYQNASVQQYEYPPHSLLISSNGPRRLAAGEPWPVQVNEFNADCPVGGWMVAGRSCSGPPYLHEGDFGPPMEWPPMNSVNFQPPAPNTASATMQISGDLSVHGVPMLPCRPDMSSMNWWHQHWSYSG